MLRSPKPAKYLGGKGDRPANTQRFPPHVANENLLCCFGCDNAKLGRHKLHRSLFQSEIERFRARHRQVCRDQRNSVPNSKLEDQNEERTRKIPANWRQKQQVSPLQYEDGFWPESAGTEMRLTFNAFDFSASPEAFNDEPNW